MTLRLWFTSHNYDYYDYKLLAPAEVVDGLLILDTIELGIVVVERRDYHLYEYSPPVD